MTTTTVPETTDLDRVARIKELEAALKKAQKETAAAQAEVDALRPTINLSHRLWLTEGDVRAYFKDQEQLLRDMAEQGIVEENRIRTRRGLSPIRYDDDEWEAAIEQVVEELLEARVLNGAPEEGPLIRTIKMWNPKDQSIRQIPYEGQFNNIAGSLADGLVKYELKGFKRIEPMICAAGDCNELAAITPKGRKNAGKLMFGGYCTEDHFTRTESRNNAELPGVINRASVTPPSS